MIELALGLVHRRLGLLIVRRLLGRQVGIAVQLGQLGGRVLLQRGQVAWALSTAARWVSTCMAAMAFCLASA